MTCHSEEFYGNNSNTIVVFIHGIIESPNQFKTFNKIVKKRGYSYFNMLLPGHGKNPMYFAKNGYKKWKNYVNQKLDEFRKKYEEIIIVGHSMGCLLAINSYLYNNHKISKMFFLAIPFNISLKFGVIFESLALFFKLDKIFNIKINQINQNNISTQIPKFYEFILWIPRYLDLFYLSYKIKKNIKKVQVPIIYIQSVKDELVSIKSAKILYKNCNNLSKIILLKNSGHSKYSKKDIQIILQNFEKFLD